MLKNENSSQDIKNKVHIYSRRNIPRSPDPISFVQISFNRGPRVSKKPKRISADGLFSMSYDRFTKFWGCSKGFPKN